jgi:hypothetical protein
MNIFEIEAPLEIVAKTCGCREKNRLRDIPVYGFLSQSLP